MRWREVGVLISFVSQEFFRPVVRPPDQRIEVLCVAFCAEKMLGNTEGGSVGGSAAAQRQRRRRRLQYDNGDLARRAVRCGTAQYSEVRRDAMHAMRCDGVRCDARRGEARRCTRRDGMGCDAMRSDAMRCGVKVRCGAKVRRGAVLRYDAVRWGEVLVFIFRSGIFPSVSPSDPWSQSMNRYNRKYSSHLKFDVNNKRILYYWPHHFRPSNFVRGFRSTMPCRPSKVRLHRPRC